MAGTVTPAWPRRWCSRSPAWPARWSRSAVVAARSARSLVTVAPRLVLEVGHASVAPRLVVNATSCCRAGPPAGACWHQRGPAAGARRHKQQASRPARWCPRPVPARPARWRPPSSDASEHQRGPLAGATSHVLLPKQARRLVFAGHGWCSRSKHQRGPTAGVATVPGTARPLVPSSTPAWPYRWCESAHVAARSAHRLVLTGPPAGADQRGPLAGVVAHALLPTRPARWCASPARTLVRPPPTAADSQTSTARPLVLDRGPTAGPQPDGASTARPLVLEGTSPRADLEQTASLHQRPPARGPPLEQTGPATRPPPAAKRYGRRNEPSRPRPTPTSTQGNPHPSMHHPAPATRPSRQRGDKRLRPRPRPTSPTSKTSPTHSLETSRKPVV
jgi:hypothetical protein